MIARQQTAILAGDRVIYTVRRSRRAKRLLLHVDDGGHIEVVVPWRVSWQAAEDFVRDKQLWLSRHRTARRLPWRTLTLEDGSYLPFLGQHLRLHIIRDRTRTRSTVVASEGVVRVTVPHPGSVRKAIETWYRREAAVVFTSEARHVADRLAVSVGRVVVGNHRSQWGSCSARGRLSFNWRLLLGPRWVMDYVVAHEVVHLIHHNHSSQYWAVVARIYPRFQEARRWLRTSAGALRW
jgi:predicted metal-dependent hydrolase